jgi:hypothetical protein
MSQDNPAASPSLGQPRIVGGPAFREAFTRDTRDMLSIQLEARFGPLTPTAKTRLGTSRLDQLRALSPVLLRAASLREMGLEG